MMKYSNAIYGVIAGILSTALWVLSIPPFELSESAYVAFVPLLLWLYSCPSRRTFWAVAIATGWIAWLVILIWLRHVTWFGTIALSGLLGVIFAFWLALAARSLRRLAKRGFLSRVMVLAGLAGEILENWEELTEAAASEGRRVFAGSAESLEVAVNDL